MPKVIFFTSLASKVTERLLAYAPANFNIEIHPANLPLAEKCQVAREADFLILFPGHVEEEVLRATQKLRLAQLVGVGYDRMDLPLCSKLGIAVATNGGANALDVAEHTIAMILAVYRRFIALDANVRNSGWRALDSGLTTYTIAGKTIGIIGMGQIGKQVSRLLNAFGATVFYHDAFRATDEVEQELDLHYLPLDELLSQSDVISLHVPLLPATHGLIGERELALMKPNALLVNTCRGPVVQEAALIDALQRGQILGAALDVLETEPPAPDNPLLQLDNLLLTPHTAGVTYDTWPRRGEFIFQNLQRVWDGQEALAVVN